MSSNPANGSRVIQGFFPGGRPNILQLQPATPAPSPAAVARQAPPPSVARFAPRIAPLAPFPGPVQPRMAPGRVAPHQPPSFPSQHGSVQPMPATHPPGLAHRGAILPSRPGAVQPAPKPPRPGMVTPLILPSRPDSILLKASTSLLGPGTHTPIPTPVLPGAIRPAAMQPSGGNAFALPPTFRLRPPGTGQRLPEAIQRKMESFFKADFSGVRVHVGSEASSIGAHAFAIGTDLYFAPGQYQPDTVQGQRLLGHELTHVVQQKAGRVRNPMGSVVAVVQDPMLEAEAERMGSRIAMIPDNSTRMNSVPQQSSTIPHFHNLSISAIGIASRSNSPHSANYSLQRMKMEGFWHGLASRDEYGTVGPDDANGNPTDPRGNVHKTYLYVGAGDFSTPARKVVKSATDHRTRVVCAIDIQTETQLNQKLNYAKNSATVAQQEHGFAATGVDATEAIKGKYDRIILENLRTGDYGDSSQSNGLKDMECYGSNATLLDKVLARCRDHLEPNGLLIINVCGYPFIKCTYGERSKFPERQGMGMDTKAGANTVGASRGWQLVDHKEAGQKTVLRNNGDAMTLKVYKISYRQV